MSTEFGDKVKNYLSTTVDEDKTISMQDYFEIVKKHPTCASLAHKRIFDMISSHGVEYNEETKETKYKFFDRELFGIEDSTAQIMEYFKAASIGSEVGKRFLLLYGPVSSGKSCLLSMIKRGLEEWSRTDDGALYVIDGCPMNEQPLNAIPKELRADASKELGVDIDPDASLCPRCRLRLKDEFGGDFMKLGVRRKFFSEDDRVGIGTFAPSDPKSQDISELIGGIDLSKVGEFGSESDPRAYKFDGELNISNRGMIEFIEILKVDTKFLYTLLTATQEKVIKIPRYPLMYVDEAIISHTNETEYRDFVGNPKNEALMDRMIVCKVKYNLKVDDEVRIYEKLFHNNNTRDIHVAPHTFKLAAMFAVLSRLSPPKDFSMDVVKKMHYYNGDDVDGISKNDMQKVKKESDREGMDGASPRYVINRLVTSAIRVNNDDRRYITPSDALKSLLDGLETSSKFTSEEKIKYKEFIEMSRKEYDSIAKAEVQKAFFVSFEEEAKALVDNYLDQVDAYLDKRKITDEMGEELPPDEKLMRSIESKINISESAKDSFRNEIFRKIGQCSREGIPFRYEEHAKLKKAIEEELFEVKRDVIRMTISSRTKEDPEQLKRVNDVVRVLCERHGYIEESAQELLNYVSSMMAREK